MFTLVFTFWIINVQETESNIIDTWEGIEEGVEFADQFEVDEPVFSLHEQVSNLSDLVQEIELDDDDLDSSDRGSDLAEYVFQQTAVILDLFDCQITSVCSHFIQNLDQIFFLQVKVAIILLKTLNLVNSFFSNLILSNSLSFSLLFLSS